MTQQNLAATVFVYRYKRDGTIQAHYIDTAKILEDDIEWEHLATLEPRRWIEHHYDGADQLAAAQGQRNASNRKIEELTDQLAAAQARIDELEKDAARYRWLRSDIEWVVSKKVCGTEFSDEWLDAAIDETLAQTEVK